MFATFTTKRLRRTTSLVSSARLVAAIGVTLTGLLPATSQAQGTVEAWGWDIAGQVTNTPGGAGFAFVAKGFGHSLAVSAGGSITAWGLDTFGQVSNAPLGTGFAQVAGGGGHSMALRVDGSLVSWGSDGGLGGGQVSNTPNGNDFVQIACGGGHSLALHTDGSIAAWGEDTFGQVSAAPTGTGFLRVAAGRDHSMALAADGSIVSWGNDAFGVVSNTPGGTGFTDIAGGTEHSLAIRADGSVAAWGFDLDGQVSGAPGGTGFVRVSAGQAHSLALHADGSIVSWGYDLEGQVSNTPAGAAFSQIAVGFGRHSMALRAVPGFAYCLGNGHGISCPCSNDNDGTNGAAGCANGVNSGGARLDGLGLASVASDSVVLSVSGADGSQPALLFSGTTAINGGLGITFGDGLRCAGGAVKRLQILSMAGGAGSSTVALGEGLSAGDTRRYQVWYRNPASSPCGTGFNTTNGYEITWGL